MSTTKQTEMSSKENSLKENIESTRKRIKKFNSKPITTAKPTIAEKIKRLDSEGFDHNRIAAMLMCQKSLVKEVLA
tara:strand:- start:4028 stop:4255 length:228 start_codon:yes stop_codon:yes gene_type:complete